MWDCWGFSLLRFGFGLEVPRTKPGPVRGWQVSAAALSGGLGSLPSTQKEQEQTAVSRGAGTFPHKTQGCHFFFFFSPLEAKIVKQ